MRPSISLNPEDVRLVNTKLDALAAATQRSVIARSINRTANFVRAEGVRQAREILPGLKARDIRSRFFIDGASASNLFAVIGVSGRPLSLFKFAARPSRPTRNIGRRTPGRERVTAVIQGGTLFQREGAFVRDIAARGGLGIFTRVTRSRLPIRKLFGPSVGESLAPAVPAIQELAVTKMLSELAHNIDFALSKS